MGVSAADIDERTNHRARRIGAFERVFVFQVKHERTLLQIGARVSAENTPLLICFECMREYTDVAVIARECMAAPPETLLGARRTDIQACNCSSSCSHPPSNLSLSLTTFRICRSRMAGSRMCRTHAM
jgi:hypothetical protein